jgi:ferredoxin-NADP reductase
LTEIGRRSPWTPAEVVEVRDETSAIRTLVLDVPEWPGHRAGQSVDVRLTAESGYATQRPYSLASAPEDPRLELTVQRMGDGEVSPWLAREARAGDQLEIRGPGGRSFSWHVEDGGPLLLVAGGSGLVPLRAMLRHRLALGAELDTRLVLSVRTEADRLYAAEIEAWRAAGVEVTVTLTRAGGRRVDAAMLAEAGPPPEARPHVFVCGPTAFVEAAATHLLRAGHATERVRTERFGGAV